MGKEQKKLVLGASTSLAFLLLLAWLYATVNSPDVSPVELWKDQQSNNGGSLSRKKADHDEIINIVVNDPFDHEGKDQQSDRRSSLSSKKFDNEDEATVVNDPFEFPLRRLVRGEDRIQLDQTGFACHTDLYSELCVANRQVRIDNKALTVHISSSQSHELKRIIKPYPTKDPLYLVTAVQIVNGGANSPDCHYTHAVPALVFSSGGFAGNLFHEFNEIIIPLFLTSRNFRSQVKFVIVDYNPSWVRKYRKVLSRLSRYEFVNPAANGSVHCFPGAVIGLKYHGFLSLNTTDIPGGYSMFDFRKFLGETYNFKYKSVSEIKRKKPLLILISRRNTRKFLNEHEMVVMMEELGFEVLVVTRPKRMSNLNKFAKLMNSCSVMVGAHGAGMANEMFLPAGAVAVQVVPIGLEWGSSFYYGDPTRAMGVKHLEYKIEPEENSPIETYGRDDPVITDPWSLFSKGYQAARAVYLDAQNLRINVTRFRETLIKAKDLTGQSSPLN